jgi:hypothetical protein
MAIAIDAADALALEYRRGARRLRGVYGAQPARLQRSLRDLARRHDLRRLMERKSRIHDYSSGGIFAPSSGTPGEGWGGGCVERAPYADGPHANPPPEYRRRGQDSLPPRTSEIRTDLTELEHRFAAVVMGQFEGPVLCFSRRKAMLDLAARLGIGKFHANFIIASLQQRRNGLENTTPPEYRAAGEKVGFSWSTLVCALAIQSIIAVGLWMVLK